MKDKRRLGRGLGALIPEIAGGGSALQEIELEKIRPNPHQPRIRFDQEKLHELAESIRAHGVVQPVLVAPAGEEYVLVAGERRYRAAKLAGLSTIPAVARELDRSTMLQIALIENLQREDLNPVEEASAYRQLIEQFNFTQEELAHRLGKSRSAIANTMRLLSLPAEVKEALARGEISAGQARPLLRLPEEGSQRELAQQIIREGLTARAVEKLAARWGKETAPAATPKPKTAPPNSGILYRQDAQERLQRYLGTRVRLQARKNGGTIEVDFFGDEDLERLIGLILASTDT